MFLACPPSLLIAAVHLLHPSSPSALCSLLGVLVATGGANTGLAARPLPLAECVGKPTSQDTFSRMDMGAYLHSESECLSLMSGPRF